MMKIYSCFLNPLLLIFILLAGCSTSVEENSAIPFETFTNWERVEGASPLFTATEGYWAAAAHAIVVGAQVEYLWSMRDPKNFWDLRRSWAPISDLTKLTHDPRNPILTPPKMGMDSKSIEYPNPFYNPYDGRYYIYYLVREDKEGIAPKQTGLLLKGEDFGVWTRAQDTPVIASEFPHERQVAGHTSTAIVGDTIHIIYTGMESWKHNPTICHATAPVSDPTQITKNPDNPVFSGSAIWDSEGVREAELLKGPEYFHIFYDGRGEDRVYHIGHIRTKDFKTFEPNPDNPIFITNEDPDAWDSDGLLTPQVFELGDYYYMLYAGLHGEGWNKGHCQSGLARVFKYNPE
ncbi:MAG: hypothetical protein P8L44_15930 [Opitutales bacterium]|nr:hypothetical protein [Opitutales bacterium]